MEKIKGTVLNADGDSGKPVMPSAPVESQQMADLIKRRDALKATEADYMRQIAYHTDRSDWKSVENVNTWLSQTRVDLNNTLKLIESLSAEYNAAYNLYKERMSQYNIDYAAWANSTAAVNNTDPAVLKAQIEAEKAKTDNALAVEKAKAEQTLSLEKSKAELALAALLSGSAASNKKLIVIAVVVVVVVIAIGVLIYFIRKNKK